MSPLPAIETSPARSRVVTAIATAAADTGVDFTYLLNQAKVESQLNPKAQAGTSSATGLFQFTRQTWLATLKQHGAAHGFAWAADAISQTTGGKFKIDDPEMRSAILDLREEPEASSAMAAELAADNGSFLAANIGRSAQPVELYLAHFLGAAGALRFVTAHADNPGAPAAALFPQAAAANGTIFFAKGGTPRTLDEIRSLFVSRLEQAPQSASGAQFALAAPSVASSMQSSIQNMATVQNMTLRQIEPMPTRLSLDFARQAYQRLASLGETVAR